MQLVMLVIYENSTCIQKIKKRKVMYKNNWMWKDHVWSMSLNTIVIFCKSSPNVSRMLSKFPLDTNCKAYILCRMLDLKLERLFNTQFKENTRIRHIIRIQLMDIFLTFCLFCGSLFLLKAFEMAFLLNDILYFIYDIPNPKGL